MSGLRVNLAVAGIFLALCGVAGAQPATKPMVTLQAPALPDPARLTLDPAKTALLLLDDVEANCAPQPKCAGQIIPATAPFLARARKAGVTVVYACRADSMDKWLAPVAPAAGDMKIATTGQDRFFKTDLEQQLKAKGITTIIMVGWKNSGSVTYTAVDGAARGFTVVVPTDTTTAATDFETAVGFFQLLNLNPANAPLKPNATTLSRSDLISFQ